MVERREAIVKRRWIIVALLLGVVWFLFVGLAGEASTAAQLPAVSISAPSSPELGVTKSVTPAGPVGLGDRLTYTLLISAAPGSQLGLYDPLQDVTFLRFVEGPPDVGHQEGISGSSRLSGVITGSLYLTPSRYLTVSFVVQVGLSGTSALPAEISNQACVYPLGGTLGHCIWSNRVINPWLHRVFLPTLLRHSALANHPPYAPSFPSPFDGATGQSVGLNLSWAGGDPDGDVVTYDVYLEADDDTPEALICGDLVSPTCDPTLLITGTQYYWQVVVADEHGAVTNGPVWNFVTEAAPPSGWLSYTNHYRILAGLPLVAENSTWSDGCWKHARYMVKNDYVGHWEDPGDEWYTPEGAEAARHSNVVVSSFVDRSDESAIDWWMQAPFHAVAIIDPKLLWVGYGSYREADGGWQMGAALDVSRGRIGTPPSTTFPLRWPSPGIVMPLLAFSGSEYPDPLTSCPGCGPPTGPAILLQLGSGHLTPEVAAHSFSRGDQPLDHCVFDETSYVHPNPSVQDTGRGILDSRDAVVLLPREPLSPGLSYTVSITVDGQTYTWSFVASSTAQEVEMPGEFLIYSQASAVGGGLPRSGAVP